MGLFFPQREDLSSQFSHMTVSHQSAGDASDLPSYYLHGALPTHSFAQSQQSYALALPGDSYVSSGMALAPPAALPPQTCSQQNNQVLIVIHLNLY